MASGAAGDGLFRGLYDGCLSGGDMGIQRRPYHKNCRCALHKSDEKCSHRPRQNKISYPIRRSWSEGSLLLIGQASPSPSSSPAAPTSAAEIPRTSSQSLLWKPDEDDEVGASLKN